MQNEKLRNVAIIAHVDHGKTTLVDQMLKQGGVYRENQETVERVMDSNDLERERGITILAKNTAIQYGDTKINIVDTPGHADFGGEVERILKMVNGVILLVDAAEGPMPQTRFVLSRALELGHRVIVVINKIDRPDQRIHEVIDEVLELLLDLDATDEQLDSPMLFCSARNGTASYSPDVVGTDLKPLFDTILDYIPAPEADLDQPFQMLVSSIDYNEFVGRIAIGRIERGVLKQNQEIAVCNYHDPDAPAKKAKAVSMYEFAGLGKVPVTEATAGNIIALSGIGDITIGDTICAPDCVEPLPFVKISAPTVEMTFSVNDSPFAGREGKFVTSRQLRLPICVPVSIYFDRSRRGMDENSRPSEFLIIIEEKGKSRKHIWKADGREAVVAYLDEYAKNVLPRLDRYEKGRPAVTGRPKDVVETTPNTINSITPPPENVNGGAI